MKRRRTILYTLTLVAGSCALAPAAAMAGGPLLSGYGGPGAGAQSIIGAALLNGPGSGSGGGSGGSGSIDSSSGNSAAGSSRSAFSTAPSRGTDGGGSGQAAKSGPVGGSAGHGGAGRTSGARTGSSTASSTGRAYPAGATSAGASWFSGADLLALLLASTVLVLVAVATVRLAAPLATHHD